MIEYEATVGAEIAHRSERGCIHGHSLSVTVWRSEACDLEWWRATVEGYVSAAGGVLLEDSPIGGRTFEDFATFLLKHVPGASRVRVSVPSRGVGITIQSAIA